ncbi:glycosyl hydrolase family 17 protein [Rubritalea marina]|uniref:glycosyl hydrolase family 17 protein n=1 Tax=Rubritalea marina TaxID=361055 RepID=UPI00035E1AB7|nr:glycosyl hydrolase family 17 protein [Rubritalea marina]
MQNKPTITVPKHSPFTQRVGINYDAWATNWYTGASSEAMVTKQIDTILPDFATIHLYRLCGWTEIVSNNDLDPVTQSVLSAVVASNQSGVTVEVSLGTSNGLVPLLANGDGTYSAAKYCSAWLNALVGFFNDTAMLKQTIKVITLGNELDTSSVTPDELGKAMDNLYAALSAHPDDYSSIPLSISLSNMSLTNKWGTFANSTSDNLMATVTAHWKSTWNHGQAFLFANHYPKWIYDPNGNKNGLDGYLAGVQAYNADTHKSNEGKAYDIDIYVGETGYTAESGKEADEATYINDLFGWLEAQRSAHGNCIPLFIFEGFNEPKKPAGQQAMGIYDCDKTTGEPEGLKANISIPKWVK